MKHRLTLLGLMLCAVLWAGCNSAGTPAEKASAGPMSKVQAAVTAQGISSAMQKATSWHMTMKSADMEMSTDIVCPDKMHSQSTTKGVTMEMIRVGNDMYTKTGSKWMKVPTAANQAAVCGAPGNGFSGGASSRVPTFDPKVTMTKGGTEMVEGESCTDWNETTSDGKGGTMTWTLCVGSDNLPRLMKNGTVTMTYTNWNKPITIEAPKM